VPHCKARGAEPFQTARHMGPGCFVSLAMNEHRAWLRRFSKNSLAARPSCFFD
jgi:hypothetical protein